MNPIYRGQYPPINTDVLWIKDNKIYIYQNDGWEAASGSNDNPADVFLSEESENLIENRAVYNQFITQEEINTILNLFNNA